MRGDRKPVHSIRLEEWDWQRLEEVIEEGRQWVRRNAREWPYGHELYPQVRQDDDGSEWVDFIFVPTDMPSPF